MSQEKTKSNKITVILGRKGCGKTTLVKELVKESPRVIIFDVIGGFKENALLVEDLDTLPDYLAKKSFKLRFESESQEEFALICDMVYSIGKCLFVVDEVNWVCSTLSLPEEFSKLIRLGRHREIDLIVATQRPADLPRVITSQADIMSIFSIVEPRDLAYLNDYIAHLNIEEKISSLKKFEYLRYDVSEDKIDFRVSKI